MNGELSTEATETIDEINETFGDINTTFEVPTDVTTRGPLRSVRIATMAFGLTCYAVCAVLYFSRPNKPILSLGQMRFTVDALMEWFFTILTLPPLGLAYFYGIRNHEKNPDFAFPDLLIDLLFVTAIVWVAIGNGIHLTAKLDEQMISTLKDNRWLGIRADFHWTRQVIGHVVPHIGWQILFSALMLGQLKRPYRGHTPNVVIPCLGIVFGLLFAQGAIAGTCTHIGFALTAISCLGFWYLGKKSKLEPAEVPTLTFFFSSQVTFLLMMIGYWSVTRLGLV
jgi:hypothetical protein